MNWEQRFCPYQDYAVDFWLVQQSSEHHELWQLRDRYGDSVFTIAAAIPVCPGCGSTLCLIVDLAERNREVLESEQMREFVHNIRKLNGSQFHNFASNQRPDRRGRGVAIAA